MSEPRSDRLSAGRVASHLGVMLVVAAVMGVVVAGLAIPFAGVLGVGARQVSDAMDNLPAELETDPLPQKTTLLDAEGNTIATLYDENRVNVSLNQVSRTMVKAIELLNYIRVLQAADLLELPAELFEREVVLTSTCWEHTVRAYAAPVGTPAPADALAPFSDTWIPLSGNAVLRHADD